MTTPDEPSAEADRTTGDRVVEADRTTEGAAESPEPARARGRGFDLPFRVLLTIGLMVAAVLPLTIFGGIVMAAGWYNNDRAMVTLLTLSIAGAAFWPHISWSRA